MSSYNAAYIQKWVEYLHAIDREMSRRAAEKLGQTGDRTVVPELIKVLKNRPDEVRVAATRALGALRDKTAVSSLIPLLDDNSTLVASTAAESLGEIAHSSAVPALIRVLRNYKTGNPRYMQIHGANRGLFMAAVFALQRIGTNEAKAAIEMYHR